MLPTDHVSRIGRSARLLLVAAIVLGVGGVFLYAGGWLSPHELTPSRFIDTFQAVNGPHPGFRRNHAKGVGVRGSFESNGQGTRLSKAVVFQPGRVRVIGRFALAGGMPYQPDALRTVRSMALQFLFADGEEWRTGMNNIPVFPVSTPEAFHEQLASMEPDPKTGKPDPGLRRRHLQQPQRVHARRRRGSIDAGALVDGPRAAARARHAGARRGRELPVFAFAALHRS
jgi:catalase